jgi:hypothetical protein
MLLLHADEAKAASNAMPDFDGRAATNTARRPCELNSALDADMSVAVCPGRRSGFFHQPSAAIVAISAREFPMTTSYPSHGSCDRSTPRTLEPLVKHTKLGGLKRNAAVVLGSIGTMEDVSMLQQALADPEPLVPEHAVWALGRIADSG